MSATFRVSYRGGLEFPPPPKNLEIEYGYYCFVNLVQHFIRSNLRGSKLKFSWMGGGGGMPPDLSSSMHAYARYYHPATILLPPPPYETLTLQPIVQVHIHLIKQGGLS